MLRNIALIALIILTLLPSGAPPAAAAPLAQSGGDWPQLQYDAQRSGAVPQAVPGPYRFYWRWNEAPLASRAQPVVAAGRLFIGSINGVVYALDADADNQGGAPTKLWTRNLGSPIRTSAAVVGETLIVGTQAGTVYGLNTGTGAERWRFLTGAAIQAAPLVAGGTAYIGSSSGVFFALNAATGAMIWNFRAGGAILSAPALSTNGAQVFFNAEDMAAYGLDAATGAMLWRAPLQGQSTGGRWAVVAGDTVIFRTQPLHHFRDLLFIGDGVLDRAGAKRSTFAADWEAVRPQIVQHLTGDPSQQTFFALNTANGASRGVAPVLYTGSSNDPASAPVVANGLLYTLIRSRKGVQNDSPVAVHIASKYDADPVTMDPRTLAVQGIGTSNAFGYQWRATSDEDAYFSMAGSQLIISNWERLGMIDLGSRQNIGIAQVAHNFPGCGSQCQANNALIPFFPAPNTPTTPSNSEGSSDAPAVAAAGRIFWRVQESGLASIGPGSAPAVDTDTSWMGPGKPAPAAAPRSDPAPQAVDLRGYITAAPTPPVAAPPADLAQRLEEEVRRIVDANGHLKPMFIERGWSSVQSWPPDSANPQDGQTMITHNSSMVTGLTYWYDPGELVYTLSSVYPYLSSGMQARLKTYLRAEIGRYSPLENLPFDGMSWMHNGVDRTGYTIPFKDKLNNWPPPATPVQTLYGIWAYAEYLNEWDYVGANWSRIDSIWDSRKNSINTYARIAGAIGYYRIAQRLGRTAEANEAVEIGNNALNAGLTFSAFKSRSDQMFPDMELNTVTVLGARGQVFFGLVPEVGRFLNERVRSAIDAEIAARTGAGGAPLWYVSKVGHQGIEPFTEHGFHGPELAWGLFLARAYGQRADQATLRTWLDRPWGLGDLFYLQKLLATIQSGTGNTSAAAPTISGVNIERKSFAVAVVRWRTNLPASGWIEYGTSRSFGQATSVWTAPVDSHRITIEGLRPNTTYYFRVCSTSSGGTTCSAAGSLDTDQATSLFLPMTLSR